MTASLRCSRCGRRSFVAGTTCTYCGHRVAPLRWVAEPPGPTATALPAAALSAPPWRPYAGAPRYRFVPRWGFPALPWAPPPVDPPGPDALFRARALVGTGVPLLWATAAVALLAAGSEGWRYALLLASRDGALSADTVAVSDALVAAAGTVAVILFVAAGGMVVMWSVRAARAAADRAAVAPARSVRGIVLGWLVPGPNLAVPGSVLAEIEHAALDRAASQRPRPSRLVLLWWAQWALGVVLAAVALLWSLRTGVQALADGVVLHGVIDLLAAATAATTAVLLTRLTRLLAPVRLRRRELLVRVPSP